MHYWLCFFLALLSPFSFGQSNPARNVDLLEKKLANADTDEEKGFLLCELSLVYSGIDSSKTFAYAESALELFQHIDNPYGVGQAYLSLAGGHFDYNDLTQAKAYYRLARTQFEKLLAQDSSIQHLKGWVKSTFNLSATLGRQKLDREALRYVMEAEPMAEKAQDTFTLALINSNLGVTFTNLERYDKAYAYFSKSGKLYQGSKASSQFIQDRLIFSFCLYGMDSLARMKEVLAQVKDTLNQTPEALEWHLYYLAQGKYLLEKGEHQAALRYYDQSYNMIEESKMSGYLDAIFQHYAEAYEEMGDYQKAKQYVLRYLAQAQQNDPERVLSAIQELARYEAREKNYEQAYHHLDQYVRQQDSLNLIETRAQFNELELQYQTQKKEREILALERQNSEVALALEKKRSQHYLMLLIAGSLAFLLVAGYFVYRHQQRKALMAHRERAEEVNRLKHEQQAKILSALMEGQEKERKRLATDLHDGLGGRLSGISLKLSKIDQDKSNGVRSHQIQEILGNLDDSLVELRGIARNLTPETLSKYGLKAALEDYCSSLNRKDSKIILQFYGAETNLEENISLTLYRIIQELINNAVKYARASEILVQYIREGNKVDITVEDDGVGFCTNGQYHTIGMGLANIKNRVKYLNGKLDLHSLANQGTTVNIQIDV